MAEYSNRLPFAADTGKGCIFISYAHRDREIVFPIITKLYEKGWPIWYDEGIEPGENWKAALNYRIGMSSLYLLFISKNSLRSVETIDHEFIVAHNFNKKIILCLIDDIDLQRDFPSLNYAAASYEDFPRTTPEHLEEKLQEIPELSKGDPRTAAGITVSAPEILDSENKQYSYEYELCNDGAVLTRFLWKGYSYHIQIPREYPVGSGVPVVELKGTFNHCFDGNSPGKLIIPDTVKRIRKGTFYGYALPNCIHVPPSIELIEENNFGLDDRSGYEIDPYDRIIKVECASDADTQRLIERVSHGVRINYEYDRSMSVVDTDIKPYAPKYL